MVVNLAHYKSGPSQTATNRKGPVQCVRNCTNCILNPVRYEDPVAEDIVPVMSYDNLVRGYSSWLTNYSTILYHLGQVHILKRSLKALDPHLVVYVVAVTERADLDYFFKVLSKENLPLTKVISSQSDLQTYQHGHIVVPVAMPSCPVSAMGNRHDRLVSVCLLRDLLQTVVDNLNVMTIEQKEKQVIVVPVAITKDDDGSSKFGIGALCVQMIEPYPLNDLIWNLKTQHKTGHLVQHIYHDLALNGSRMSTHIVAFLLLYLDRPSGVTLGDLIEYMDWLRESAMDLSLHLAFTGESDKAIEFALLVLKNHIYWDKKDGTIIVSDIKAVAQYANCVVTNVAYYGILSRAILMLYNRDEKNEPRNNLDPGVAIKVMKDDLLELGQDLAESIDTKLPCRPPCKDVQTCIVDAFTRMHTCGRYFRIQEARIRQNAGRRWAGDYDEDEEYFFSRRNDPAFKAWIIMTQRPYRLDRLNLLMNAVEPYLTSMANDSIPSLEDRTPQQI